MSRFNIWAKNNKPTAIKLHKSSYSLLKAPLLFFIALVIVFSSLATVLQPSTSSAASTATLTSLDNQIIANLYRNALATCIKSAPLKDDTPIFASLIPAYRTAINEGHALDFEWFSPGSAFSLDVIAGSVLNSAYGSGTVSKTGAAECGNPAFIQEALTKLGYSVKSGDADSVFGLLCDFGFQRNGGDGCKTGNGDWHRTNNSGDTTYAKFMATKNAKVVTLSDAAKYVLVRSTFMALCKATENNTVPDSSLSSTTGITMQSLEGTDASTFKLADHWFTYGAASSRTSWSTVGVGEGYSVGITNLANIHTWTPGSLSIDGGPRGTSVAMGQPYIFATGTAIGTQSACGSLGDSANQYAKAYLAWAVKNPKEAVQQATTIKQQAPNDTTSTCAIDGIGWIICPVITFMASIADASFGFLANSFLRTDPKVLDTSATNGTFTAWSAMRTIANVVFVIVFLIIIFSQLTSFGVSNYGVKKMLPRLIIAAILVNLSYFVSQLAVDISNILGFSIKDLFNGITTQITTANTSLTSDAINTGAGLTGIAAKVIALVVAGGAAYALLSTLIPILLAAVIALIMILFILIARQAIIILLIVISPLAFVAFLLPNTEKLFTQWRKMLTAMLLLFPIIALVYGASQLASKVLSSAEAYKDASGNGGDLFGQIIAAAVLVLPLFVVPVLLKKSLDGIPVLGQMASKFASRANGNLGKKVRESYNGSLVGRGNTYKKAGTEARRSQNFAGRVARGGFSSFLAKGVAVTPSTRAGRRSLTKSAIEKSEAADAEEVKAAETLLRTQHENPTDLIRESQKALASAVERDDTVGARAAQNILLNSGGAGLKALQTTLSSSFAAEGSQNSKVGKSVRTSLNKAGLKAKNNALSTWAFNGQGLSATSRDAGTYAGLSDAELGAHSEENLHHAWEAGVLTPDRAKEILASPVVSANIGKAEKDFIQNIANGVGFVGPANKPPETPNSPGLDVPH
ncbi:MAG: hypothetical protein JWN12_464 [Candidatus Saccharibacteria bacterium]|nr:hypothetical protein [Candidatus Saccharibacteria bacterium]